MIGQGGYARTFLTGDPGIVSKSYVKRDVAYDDAFLPFPCSSPAYLLEYSLLSAFRRVPLADSDRPFVRFHERSGSDGALRMERGLVLSDPTTVRAIARSRRVGEVLVEISKSAWSSLARVHALGIAHMDVKPSNLVLARRDSSSAAPPFERPARVLLIDWNSRRFLSRDPDEDCLPGTVPGTPPEILAGGACSDKRKVDVWSMGVSLLRLLCAVASRGEAGRRGLEEDLFEKITGDVPQKRERMLANLRRAGFLDAARPKAASAWFERTFGPPAKARYGPVLEGIDLALCPAEADRPLAAEIVAALGGGGGGREVTIESVIRPVFASFPPSPCIEHAVLRKIAARFRELRASCWVADRLLASLGIRGTSRKHACTILFLAATVCLRKVMKTKVAERLCSVSRNARTQDRERDRDREREQERVYLRRFKDKCAKAAEKILSHRAFAANLAVLEYVSHLVFPKSSLPDLPAKSGEFEGFVIGSETLSEEEEGGLSPKEPGPGTPPSSSSESVRSASPRRYREGVVSDRPSSICSEDRSDAWARLDALPPEKKVCALRTLRRYFVRPEEEVPVAIATSLISAGLWSRDTRGGPVHEPARRALYARARTFFSGEDPESLDFDDARVALWVLFHTHVERERSIPDPEGKVSELRFRDVLDLGDVDPDSRRSAVEQFGRRFVSSGAYMLVVSPDKPTLAFWGGVLRLIYFGSRAIREPLDEYTETVIRTAFPVETRVTRSRKKTAIRRVLVRAGEQTEDEEGVEVWGPPFLRQVMSTDLLSRLNPSAVRKRRRR